MQLDAFDWIVICTVVGVLAAVAGWFVKKLASKPEKHDSAINQIREEFAKKETVELLGKKVNDMLQDFPQKFATKEDVKELRREMREDTTKLAADIEEIKANYLTKSDFLSNMRRTEDSVERILDILLKGGSHNG